MKHQQRSDIHMENQLWWGHKSGRAESLVIFKAGQTVSAGLMESQIWHQLASSVEGRFRKETMVSVHLDVRHFSFSLYTTGIFQAATPMLELQKSLSR